MDEMSGEEFADEVMRLTEKDENELYSILGLQALGLEDKPSQNKMLKLGGETFSMRISDITIGGESFFNSQIIKIKKWICINGHYCKKRDDMNTFIGMCSKISPFPAALAAVILALAIKYGLDALCGCNDN